jgi:outer membrane protein TolC
MKKLIIITLFLCATFSATSQSGYENILEEIEANNTTLAALRKQAEAQKIGNRTGLTPANPEVELGYLWGSPAVVGERVDFGVTQTFDFPTAYIHRNRIADLQDNNVDFQYRVGRQSILLEARRACIELNYYNSLSKEYQQRATHAAQLADAYKKKLAQGDANILEHNKAQLNLATVQAEAAQIAVEMRRAASLLRQLNGGKDINNYELRIKNYEGITMVEDVIRNSQFKNYEGMTMVEDVICNSQFKNYEGMTMVEDVIRNSQFVIENAPALQSLREQLQISREKVKLNRAMALPKLSAGYTSEKLAGEHFQGVTVGVSVPLWEDKNRVKQAKKEQEAAEAMLEDSKQQLHNRLQSLYDKVVSLQETAQSLRQSLADNNAAPLLQKALNAGEISLLDYLLETSYYYDATDRVLEAERDAELAAAELWAAF